MSYDDYERWMEMESITAYFKVSRIFRVGRKDKKISIRLPTTTGTRTSDPPNIHLLRC